MTAHSLSRFVAAVTLAASVAVLAQDNSRAAVALQAAVAKETIQGDVKGAIALYEQAFKEAGTNRPLAARALIGLAQAQEKDGRAEARATYGRIVREYADSGDPYTAAQARLAVMLGGPGQLRQAATAGTSAPEADLVTKR